MKFILLFIALLYTMSSYASLEGCEKKISFDDLYMQVISDGSELAQRTVQDLDELRKIIENVDSEDSEPLVNSMNKKQVAEFAKVKSRILTKKMAEIVVSRRERDVLIILDFIERLEGEYQGKELEAANPDEFRSLIEEKYYNEILNGEKEIPYPELTAFIYFGFSEFDDELFKNIKYKDAKCNVVALLVNKQNIVARRLNDINKNTMKKYKEFKEKLRVKYKDKEITIDMLTANERSLNAHYMKVLVKPAGEIINMIKGYELVKTLIYMNNKIYEYDMKDVYIYAGDNEKLGTTLAKDVQSEKYQKIELHAVNIWRSMNKLIPPRAIIEASEASRKLTQ